MSDAMVASRQRILVLTGSHLCRNPRVVKEAQTLAGAGFDVTVLNVASSRRFAAVDQTMLHDLTFRVKSVDLLGRTPRSRLFSLLSRASTWMARRQLRWTGWQLRASLGPVKPLLHAARQFPADLYIVHNEAGICVGNALLKSRRRVAVDVEDWHSEDLLPNDRKSRPLALLRHEEQFILTHAAYASCPSESMAAALHKAYGGRRPHVIRNTFPLLPGTALARGASTSELSFVWFSQTVGPGRGLEEFINAWRLMRTPVSLWLRGDLHTGFREALLADVSPSARARLHFLPLIEPLALARDLARFDVGLALEKTTPLNRALTSTNKIFQYMNAGLAVVASRTPGQVEVMETAPRAGILVDLHSPIDLARSLDALVANATALREMQQESRTAAVDQFCWEKDAVKLLNAVNAALRNQGCG